MCHTLTPLLDTQSLPSVGVQHYQMSRAVQSAWPERDCQRLLQGTRDLLTPHLGPFRGTFTLKYYLTSGRYQRQSCYESPEDLTTEPPRPTDPSLSLTHLVSYYRRALLNPSSTEHKSTAYYFQLSSEVDQVELPLTHCTLHLLVDKVKSAWRRGNVMSIMFLDIKSAFPSVVPDRLIHDMRQKEYQRN